VSDVSSFPEPPGGRIPLARSSAILFGSSLVGNAGYFVSVLMLARTLGASGRGSIAFVIVTCLIVARVVSLGLGEATTVFAAQRPAERGRLLANMVLFTAATGALGAAATVGLLVAAEDARPEGIGGIELVAIALGIAGSAISVANWGFLQGAGRFPALSALTAISPWAYAVLLAAIWAGPGLTIGAAALAWAAHAWFDALVGVAVSARKTPLRRPSRRLAMDALGFGTRAWVGTLAGFLNARADQLLMAFIATEAALGVYAVAVNASETLLYLSGALGLALLPRIASAGREERVATTLDAFRRLFLVILAGAAVAALIGPPLLPVLFGAEFSASREPFLLLLPGALGYAALTVFTNALSGSSAPGRASVASFLALATGVALDLLLIPRYDASGAAAAASAAFIVGGIAAVVLFRRREPFRASELVPRGADARAVGTLVRRGLASPRRRRA
jgi:O-antigen/teichoic acid export membrane protein